MLPPRYHTFPVLFSTTTLLIPDYTLSLLPLNWIYSFLPILVLFILIHILLFWLSTFSVVLRCLLVITRFCCVVIVSSFSTFYNTYVRCTCYYLVAFLFFLFYFSVHTFCRSLPFCRSGFVSFVLLRSSAVFFPTYAHFLLSCTFYLIVLCHHSFFNFLWFCPFFQTFLPLHCTGLILFTFILHVCVILHSSAMPYYFRSHPLLFRYSYVCYTNLFILIITFTSYILLRYILLVVVAFTYYTTIHS